MENTTKGNQKLMQERLLLNYSTTFLLIRILFLLLGIKSANLTNKLDFIENTKFWNSEYKSIPWKEQVLSIYRIKEFVVWMNLNLTSQTIKMFCIVIHIPVSTK